MPWLASRAGCDTEWWRPQINEQVCVLAPSGDRSQGIIIGSLYRQILRFDKADQFTKRDNIPDDDKAHIHSRIYRDGTRIDYESEKNTFNFKQHAKHDGDTKLELLTSITDDKAKIALKLGEACQLTMDASEDGKVEVKLGEKCQLTMNASNNGEVAVSVGNSVSMTLTGDKQIKLKAENIQIDVNVEVNGKLDVNG